MRLAKSRQKEPQLHSVVLEEQHEHAFIEHYYNCIARASVYERKKRYLQLRPPFNMEKKTAHEVLLLA